MSDIFDVPQHAPRELPPEGKHTAVLYLIADLGHHRDTFGGEEKIKHKIYLSWELVDTKTEDGRPFVIGRDYTVSPSKFQKGGYYFAKTSNIYKTIKSWANKDKIRTDPGILVDLLKASFPCSITIEHQESRRDATKTFAVIESVKPYKGKDKPERTNEAVDCITNYDDFDKLPDWIKKKINANLERNGGVPEEALTPKFDEPQTESGDYLDDSIPF